MKAQKNHFRMNKELIAKIESDLKEEIKTFNSNNVLQTISGKEYFLKQGRKSNTYHCEANGLFEMSKANKIKVAKVVSVGDSYIVTEYIKPNSPQKDFFIQFGEQLAHLHKYTTSSYGFYENNFIGDNPQINIATEEEKKNWALFYFNKRILYQYKLAEKNGYATQTLKKGVSVLETKIERIVAASVEFPSLLHGDLWGGNYLCDSKNNPVLIDPAVYYGHREADLAMTRVFGGFPQEFYDSYTQEYPLKAGWEYREGLYKLYHILNHLNLFGQSYLSEAEYLISRY